MRIGELGDRCDVSTKTIRFYESINLLSEPDRTTSGYRDYDEDAVQRLQFMSYGTLSQVRILKRSHR